MKIGISFGFYILFLIANIEGRFLLVNVGNPDVDDDNDSPQKQKPINSGDPDVDEPRKEKPKIERNPRTEWCPECCGDPGCDLTDCFNPFICSKLSNLEKNPSNDASMPKCPSCCPICNHGFCADPKICPEFAPELVKSKEVSAKIPEIIEQPAKIDNTQLTVKKPKCPECCYWGNCATGLKCNDPKICSRQEIQANQERNQPNKDGEERGLEMDCKDFENPDNECRKDSLCSCYNRDGKRMCYGYSSCKNKSGDDPNWGWDCACKRND